MPQLPIDTTGQKIFDAVTALAAIVPTGHPLYGYLQGVLGRAAFADYTPNAANAGYVLLEPNGTLTIYTAANKAALKTYVAAIP